jgi:hypothetical protein
MAGTSMSSHRIGRISDLWMLVHKPIAAPNVCSNYCRCATFDAMGLRNRIVMSAYKLVCVHIGSTPIGWSRSACVTMSSSLCNGSIASMKSIDGRGSPYQNPQPCLIGLSASPFRRMHEDVLLHMKVMRSLHLCLNPRCSMTSSRYSHRTLSNALVMWSLTNSIGVLAWWKCFNAPWTYS